MSPDYQHKLIFVKALTFIENDRAKDAIPFLSKYLAHEPDDYEAICWLSFCLGVVKDYSESLKYATRAIQLNPALDRGYLLQSKAFCDLKEYQSSLDSALEAIRLNPESEMNLLRLTDAYLDCDRLDEAWQTGKTLQALFPHNASCFIEFSYILMEKKQFDLAQWYLEEALKIDPNSSSALNNLANIYLKRDNNPAKALEYYQLALQANPLDKLALQNIERVSMQNVSLANLAPSLRNHLVAKKTKAESELNNQPKISETSMSWLLLQTVIGIIIVLAALIIKCS